MKKIMLLTIFSCYSIIAFSQKLELNENGYYECTTVINYQNSKLFESLKSRVTSLNYDIIQATDSLLIATRVYSLGALTGQKVKYKISLEVRENRYRLVFTNFIIYTSSAISKESPLEKQLFKGSWIKQIDKDLPKLVGELDLNNVKEKKDW